VGEPAGLTVGDRADAKKAAQAIYDSVVNNVSTPSGTLIAQALLMGIPPDTLVLWLAQLTLEAP